MEVVMQKPSKGKTGTSLGIEMRPLDNEKVDCRNCFYHPILDLLDCGFNYCRKHKMKISENHAKKCAYFSRRSINKHG